MIKLNQVFKCQVCTNIIEVVHEGVGELVCCQKPMILLEEKSEDEGLEKHVPVVEKTEKGIKVKVGSIPHPMEEAHYIEWIELLANGKVYKKFLRPNEEPVAEFEIQADQLIIRECCNLHGLWKTEV